MKTEKWYQRRLAKYFDEHYGEYDDTAEWHPDPAMNQWEFDIVELDKRIMLTCYDNGQIQVADWTLSDILFRKLVDAFHKWDALYEDYIIDLIGEEGFYLMKEKRHLESCGSINGRRLYALS